MTKKILLATAALALGATAFAQNGKVGIGTTNPQTKLDINAGNTSATVGTGFKLVDGSQGAGKVLTSDSNGIASWKIVTIGVVNGTNGSGTTISAANSGAWSYTHTSITLAPGKWRVFATGFISYSGTNNIWVRSTFMDVQNGTLPSTNIVGPLFVSGVATYVGATYNGYGIYNGSVVINNTGTTLKTYYFHVGQIEGMQANTNVLNIGGGWNEDAIYALPIIN